jgi:hypothetical protein
MFDALKSFGTIVVTGPQRSGTKIVAEMLADDLGLRYVNEAEYGVHCFERFWTVLSEKAVVHGPAISAYCHLLPASVAVVFVFRDDAEIMASQAHVTGWLTHEAPRELQKYFRGPFEQSVAAVKYEAWRHFQKPAMREAGKIYIELHYPEDVLAHPRYVPSERRKDWEPQQTRPRG